MLWSTNLQGSSGGSFEDLSNTLLALGGALEVGSALVVAADAAIELRFHVRRAGGARALKRRRRDGCKRQPATGSAAMLVPEQRISLAGAAAVVGAAAAHLAASKSKLLQACPRGRFFRPRLRFFWCVYNFPAGPG